MKHTNPNFNPNLIPNTIPNLKRKPKKTFNILSKTVLKSQISMEFAFHSVI